MLNDKKSDANDICSVIALIFTFQRLFHKLKKTGKITMCACYIQKVLKWHGRIHTKLIIVTASGEICRDQKQRFGLKRTLAIPIIFPFLN